MTPREPWKLRFLRRFGRLLGTALALFYAVFLIGEGVAEGFDVPDAETAAVVGVFAYTG